LDQDFFSLNFTTSSSKNFAVGLDLASGAFLPPDRFDKEIELIHLTKSIYFLYNVWPARCIYLHWVREALVSRKPKDMKMNVITATYFGIEVEVLIELKNYSLIQFQGREYIVDTTDLVFISERSVKGAACKRAA
jgi:hypothetical protein